MKRPYEIDLRVYFTIPAENKQTSVKIDQAIISMLKSRSLAGSIVSVAALSGMSALWVG
jgi:hypothetical protein